MNIKKILITVLCSILVGIMVFPINAMADVTENQMNMSLDKPEIAVNAVPVEIEDYFEADGHTTSTVDPFVYTYLKAKVDEPRIYVNFSVPEDGIYDIVVEVMASTSTTPRTGLVQVDDSEKVYMYTEHGDRTGVPEYFSGMKITLSAGEHVMRFFLGDDFDDSTVKSLFLDKFYVIKTADIPTVVIEEEIVEDITPATVSEVSAIVAPTAPQTSDISVIISGIGMAASALMVFGINPRKKK